MTDDGPRESDLRIIKQRHSATRFMVGVDPDHPQLSCETYEEALSHATRTAQRLHVDVWFTADGSTFESVARYRTSSAG